MNYVTLLVYLPLLPVARMGFFPIWLVLFVTTWTTSTIQVQKEKSARHTSTHGHGLMLMVKYISAGALWVLGRLTPPLSVRLLVYGEM